MINRTKRTVKQDSSSFIFSSEAQQQDALSRRECLLAISIVIHLFPSLRLEVNLVIYQLNFVKDDKDDRVNGKFKVGSYVS